MEWEWFKIPFFVVFRSLKGATIDKYICLFCLDMITGTRNGSCRTYTYNVHFFKNQIVNILISLIISKNINGLTLFYTQIVFMQNQNIISLFQPCFLS